MKKIAPHLPAPTCDVKKHREWQRIKIILLSSFFGLVAGITGASVMLGFIWPTFDSTDVWTIGRYSVSSGRSQLEGRIQREIDQRTLEIYSAADVLGGVGYLSKNKMLGNAMIISSDGWVSMYLPSYSGNFRGWKALSHDGTVYEIEKVLADRISGLIFIQLDLSGQNTSEPEFSLSVVNFADSISLDSDFYIFNGANWRSTNVVGTVLSASDMPHLDSAPITKYIMESDFKPGEVVINNQGRVVGITIGADKFIPYNYITRLLPQVLNKEKISYPTLNAEGWYSKEQPIVAGGKNIKGFFVARTLAFTPLKPGDVVLTLNGQVIENGDLWYNVSIGEKVELTVLRGGKEIRIEAMISEK